MIFRLITQVFIAIATLVNVSDHTKRISVKHQLYMTRPTFIDLNIVEYNQRLCYYAFSVNTDRFKVSCNNLDNLSVRICVPNKTEVVKLNVFTRITKTNESKTLTNDISRECK